MKLKIITIILLLFAKLLPAQEILSELQSNPVVYEHSKKFFALKSTKSSEYKPVKLPFRDDFSVLSVFPDTSLWIDNDVFINNSYPLHPVTIGVATFDALNDSGVLYPNADFYPFKADYLTSKPIRLDSVFSPSKRALKVSDSVYFSFYVQPGGIANAPETDDSLVLEFLEVYRFDTIIDTNAIPYDTAFEDKWTKVWGSKGMSLDTFLLDNDYFAYVRFPILDSATYFRNNFQFRFRNYASLSNDNISSWPSNCDFWNIDYVYIDINRQYYDTALNDVGFINTQTSMLNDFESMPWSHFNSNPSAYMQDSTFSLINNLNEVQINMPLFFQITELGTNSVVYNPFPGGDVSVIEPFSDTLIERSFNYTFSATTSPYLDFEVLKYISPSTDTNQFNDTIRFYQRFYNYFAYDDGSPEAGYGLKPAYSRLAYQFTLNHADTLQAMQMFFNQTLNNSSQKYFYLMVWDDDNGQPGDVIYKESVVQPEYEIGINKFHNYVLNYPVPVSGTFYVGWQQTTNDNLNLGFDRNKNNQARIFVNIFGTWENSIYEGSLLIRPVMGSDPNPHQGFSEISAGIYLNIFPNPAQDYLHIDVSTEGFQIRKTDLRIQIMNNMGEVFAIKPFEERIRLHQLPSGLYFISVFDIHGNFRESRKFILTD